MASSHQTLTDLFFRELDHGFNNSFKEAAAEPYVYKTTNLLVHQKFELPVPCATGSVVKYKFVTEIGDIAFSMIFCPIGKTGTVIVESTRVPSDVEPITGSYKATTDGTLILSFDNTFSWFNPKTLSYVVELHQPAFALADKNRCLKSRILLATTIDDTHRAELRLVKAQERYKSLKHEIPVLEEKLAALQLELAQKKSSLSAAKDENTEMIERIKYNVDKKNGLCIRCLTKPLLTEVLSYLGPKSAAFTVCKYWHLLHKEAYHSLALDNTSKSSNGSDNNHSNSSAVATRPSSQPLTQKL